MKSKLLAFGMAGLFACIALGQDSPTAQQLARWLERFPAADLDGDGRLTAKEAAAFRQNQLRARRPSGRLGRGAPREFSVDPGWQEDRFPDYAMCYQSPEKIAATFGRLQQGRLRPVTSYSEPEDGSLRIVGTGHSFMAPGYQSFPAIVRAAGLNQPPPLLHTGGGITGSARYNWEQENGIFQFDRKPVPKLLASIANAQWDVMVWGPYFNDQPEYYACWIDFCLQYHPKMKFYLSDAWPQLDQLDEIPTSESGLTADVFIRLGKEQNKRYGQLVDKLNRDYPNKVFILPTCDAMVLAVQNYHRGELPGVEGIHTYVGKKERSLWRDRLGHLGPGFGQLEGYVFYATIYGQSPVKIREDIRFGGSADYPSRELDQAFRRIAWQATVGHPLSGVVDADGDGVSDDRQ